MHPIERAVVHLISNGKDLFSDWFNSLKDSEGRKAIDSRVTRLRQGNFGDHRSVGGGVSELRIHQGPGYRVYFGEDGQQIVFLICGGDKGTQEQDIRRAQALWEAHQRLK